MSQGYALGKLGKLNEAIVMFDMAITINPNDAKSYICKGFSFILIIQEIR